MTGLQEQPEAGAILAGREGRVLQLGTDKISSESVFHSLGVLGLGLSCVTKALSRFSCFGGF